MLTRPSALELRAFVHLTQTAAWQKVREMLTNELEAATKAMSTADAPSVHRAQGRYQALKEILALEKTALTTLGKIET